MPKGVYKRVIPVWNKGKKGVQKGWNKGLKRPHTEEDKIKMSKIAKEKGFGKWMARKQSKEFIQKRVEGRRGYKHSKETIEKIRYSNGIKKGFITPINTVIRNSDSFQEWRRTVFLRDNFTCQMCNHSGGYLHAHHINNFADFPELRLNTDNGVTLCKKCHTSFHKQYGYRNNTREQLMDYLN